MMACGGTALELASGSAAALQDIEAISIPAQPFAGGYVGTRAIETLS